MARSFDLLSANMVVEHMQDPLQFLKEARRVLRPGGRFIFHTTNKDNIAIRIAAKVPQKLKAYVIRLLDGRAERDVFPTVYEFNSREDIDRLAREGGFRVQELNFISNAAFTATLGPVSFFELLWLRRIAAPGFEKSRTNIIGVLEAEPGPSDPAL